MTALHVETLKSRLCERDPRKRLVISPLLDPGQQLKSGQAAIDVRLGRAFALVKPWTQGVAEHVSMTPLSPEPPLEHVVLDFGEPLIIHPHQFVLARTLEYIRMPADLLAYVIGRSSWGRRGLIVATAVVVHPAFAGPITLELKNLGEVPIALYPLERVAQLAFHHVVGGDSAETSSQFASTFSPTLGTVRDAATEGVLTKLASRRKG